MKKETKENSIKRNLKNVLIMLIIAISMCTVGLFASIARNINSKNTDDLEVSGIINDNKELSNKLLESENQTNSLKEEKEKLNNQLSELNGKIENLENENKNLSEQVNTLQQTVTSLENEKNELKTQLQNLQQQKKSETSKSTYSSNSKSTKSNSTQQNSQTNNSTETVYITNTGKKYHRSGCSYLKSSTRINKSEAVKRGYTPCSRCKP